MVCSSTVLYLSEALHSCHVVFVPSKIKPADGGAKDGVKDGVRGARVE
jgi:hypothetical protein